MSEYYVCDVLRHMVWYQKRRSSRGFLCDSWTCLGRDVRRCADYVQLYVDLQRPEVAERATPSFTLCGNRSSLSQTKYYSSQRSLILEFHADTRQTNNTGFRGVFRFLDKRRFPSPLTVIFSPHGIAMPNGLYFTDVFFFFLLFVRSFVRSLVHFFFLF